MKIGQRRLRMATKTKKLLKSQKTLLANRQDELAQSRNAVMQEIIKRDNEIIQNLLQGFGVELGLDFDGEDWEYNGEKMMFVMAKPKQEVKKIIPKKK